MYRRYGYDFQYYDGSPMDQEKMNDLLGRLHGHTDLILASCRKYVERRRLSGEEVSKELEESVLRERKENIDENRSKIASILMRGLRFVNKNGAPLNFMPLLELDPALLEQPLYH